MLVLNVAAASRHCSLVRAGPIVALTRTPSSKEKEKINTERRLLAGQELGILFFVQWGT